MKRKTPIFFKIIKSQIQLCKKYFLGFSIIGLTACGAGDLFSDFGVTISSKNSLVVSEDGTSITFTVVMNSAPNSIVSLDLSSSDLTEGTVSPATISFDESNWDVEKTITITGVDDDIVDGNQSFTINTSPLVSDDENYSGINPPDVSIINSDNDALSITISPSELSINETGGNSTATFSVVLNTEPESTVNINVTTTDITEALMSVNGEDPVENLNLEFSADDWRVPKNVMVHGQDDNIVDGNQMVVIQLANTASDDPNYDDLSIDDISATIIDNNIAAVTIDPTRGLKTTENGGQASFTVLLNTQPSADVSFNMSSSNIKEGTIDKSSLTFTPQNYATRQIVTITGVDDNNVDGTQTYTIEIDKIDSSDEAYDGLDPTDIVVQNFDNEAGISIAPVAGLSTTESGSTATFTVVLNKQPTANMSLQISSDNPKEGLIKGGDSPNTLVNSLTLTFTPDDWSTVQRVVIVGQDDDVSDGNQSYAIITAPALSDDPWYTDTNPDDVLVTNRDNDIADISINNNGFLITSEDGEGTSFNVVLNSEPTSDVVLNIQSSNVLEGLISGGDSPVTPIEKIEMIFTPEDWLTSQTVEVVGQDDDIADGDQTYNIDVSVLSSIDSQYAALEQKTILITNNDNEKPSGGVDIVITDSANLITTEAGDTAAFSIALNSRPDGDVVISATSSNPSEGLLYTVLSDSPSTVVEILFSTENWNLPQTIAILGQPDEEEDGDVEFSIKFLVDGSSTLDTTGYASQTLDDVNVINRNVLASISNSKEEGFRIINVTATDLPYKGEVRSSEVSAYLVNNLKPNTSYLITFSEYRFNNLFGSISGRNINCLIYVITSESTICSALTDKEGKLSVLAAGFEYNDDGTFVFSIEENNRPALEGARDNPLVLDAAIPGFLENRKAGLQPSYYQLTNLLPDTSYLVDISAEFLSPVNLRLYSDMSFIDMQCADYIDDRFSDLKLVCLAKSDNAGNLWVSVNQTSGDGETEYQIGVERYDGILSEGSEELPILLEPESEYIFYSGSVSVLSSYYQITGLDRDTLYVVSIAESSDNVDLIVDHYIGDERSNKCRVFYASCYVKSDQFGRLWIEIDGRSTENGATFIFEVIRYNGALSEGNKYLPKNLAFDDAAFLYAGSASPKGSYYKISGLAEDALYTVGFSDLTSDVDLSVYSMLFNYPTECSARARELNDISCLAKSDALGNLWVRADASRTINGGTFDLTLVPYEGSASEGNEGEPVELVFGKTAFPYTGSANPRGSYYKISGLDGDTLYTVGLSNLTDVVGLSAYSTLFNYPAECSVWSWGDSVATSI